MSQTQAGADLGVVIVHYRTPDLTRRAVASLRAQSEAVDIVVVDNGSTREGREILAELPVRVIDAGGNTGYAGGINRGVAAMSGKRAYVAMNPDLHLLPGCLETLRGALRDGAGVAGPCFWWSRESGFQLPPAEQRGRRRAALRLLAERSPSWQRRARRAWRRHARRHWEAQQAIPSHDLSGALLMIDSDAWRHVGPFDEGYRLYFEETDWLHRARRLGIESRYVPSAQVEHLYAQSTRREPQAESWFAASHDRFRRRHYGRLFATTLGAVDRGLGQFASKSQTAIDDLPAPPESMQDERVRWIEISPSPLGFPAAGRRVEGLAYSAEEPLIDRGLLEQAGAGALHIAAVDEAGEELDCWSWS